MANFPTSVSTNSNLYIAVNGLQTTLAASILSTDTTIQLTSTTGFPTTGFVTIDNSEVVSYTGVSGANLTGCTRGADGTTAAPHSLGVTVGATIVAAHHNLLKDEIIAIETALGANLSNVQPAGNYITALTGDVSATGPGSITATVNSVGGSSAANVHSAELAANAATSNATASTIVKRDANANAKVNTIVENLSSTVTAASTTALTAASSPIQQFTGTTTQTVTLPDATTLSVGYQINVLNRSTGVVTVNNFGNVLQLAINGGNQTTFTLTNNSTTSGVWDVSNFSGASALLSYVEYVVGTASGAYSGSTTVFDLPFAYNPNGQSLSVFWNGQQFEYSDDYAETSATRITTTNPLPIGSKIWFRTISSTTVVSPVTLFREDYVVGTPLNNYTGSSTVFNLVNTYNVGGNVLVVTVDGDVQTKGATIDYLETNNATVTFNNALVTGQKVSFMWANTAPAGGTVNSGTAGQLAKYNANGTVLSGYTMKAPTIQRFLSGSGTYTTPTSPAPLYIIVKMIGGGGGGAGAGISGGGNGGAGANTTWGPTAVAGAGSQGIWGTLIGGGGGSNTIDGTVMVNVSGNSGQGGAEPSGSGDFLTGGNGGAGFYGGGGGGSANTSGGSASTNSGGGGGGGGFLATGAAGASGAGGGAGGYMELLYTSPAATYAYSVGTGGTAGSPGTSGTTGGAGGSGIIIVEEHYQ